MKCINQYGLLIVLFLSVEALSQTDSPTNQSMLQNLMDRLADKVVERFILTDESRLEYSDLQRTDPAGTWLMDRFYKRLMDEGIKIRFGDGLAASEDRLQLNIIDFYIQYEGIYRKYPWSRGRIRRLAGIVLACRYIERNNATLIAVEEFHEQSEDTITCNDLNRLEAGGILPLKPERPGERGIRKWAEPAVFALALAGLSYAFYSVRSR